MTSDRRLDTDQLHAFERVVREGGFSRAAFALGVGQPAVSARIQALEETVGGPLFTRGRRVALTALGEAFLPYARRALEVLSEGIGSARLARVGHRGKVSLATLGSLARGLVGPALVRFLESFPSVECGVRSGDHEVVMSLLLDGIVELGLVLWPSPEPAAADLTPLVVLRESVPLVAHPSHPLATRKRVAEEDVAALSAPFLRLRWWRQHHPHVARISERSGAHVEVPMETARHLVLRGAGAGFFTKTYIAEDLAEGRVVAIHVADLAPFTRGSALVTKRRAASLSPAASAFVEALRAESARLGLTSSKRRHGQTSPSAPANTTGAPRAKPSKKH